MEDDSSQLTEEPTPLAPELPLSPAEDNAEVPNKTATKKREKKKDKEVKKDEEKATLKKKKKDQEGEEGAGAEEQAVDRRDSVLKKNREGDREKEEKLKKRDSKVPRSPTMDTMRSQDTEGEKSEGVVEKETLPRKKREKEQAPLSEGETEVRTSTLGRKRNSVREDDGEGKEDGEDREERRRRRESRRSIPATLEETIPPPLTNVVEQRQLSSGDGTERGDPEERTASTDTLHRRKPSTLMRIGGVKDVQLTPALKEMLIGMGFQDDKISEEKLEKLLEGGGVLMYAAILFCMVALLVGITVADMTTTYYTTWNNDALYDTTWSLWYVCFDFAWKVLVCNMAYPKALAKGHSVVLFLLGCLVHLCIYIGNSVLDFYYGVELSFLDTPGFITATFFKLVITVALDILLLPILFNRRYIKYKDLHHDGEVAEPESPSDSTAIPMTDSPGKAIGARKSEIRQMRDWAVYTTHSPPFYRCLSFVGLSTLFWIFLWYLFLFINAYVFKTDYSTYFEVTVPMMEVALWIGGLIGLITLYLPHKKTLPFAVNYLMFYIWLVRSLFFPFDFRAKNKQTNKQTTDCHDALPLWKPLQRIPHSSGVQRCGEFLCGGGVYRPL